MRLQTICTKNIEWSSYVHNFTDKKASEGPRLPTSEILLHSPALKAPEREVKTTPLYEDWHHVKFFTLPFIASLEPQVQLHLN